MASSRGRSHSHDEDDVGVFVGDVGGQLVSPLDNSGDGLGAPLMAAHDSGGLPTADKKARRLERRRQEGVARAKARRQLLCACVLCFLFMCGEVVGGYLAGSLAIMTE